MDVGLIGFGSIGERHTKNILELYPDININILTKRRIDVDFKENIKVFDSQDKFYSQNNNVFFITNETHKHVDTILRCLENNPVGLFVEKPISHNLDKIKAISTKLDESSVVFFVAYCLQFFKPLVSLKKYIKSGIIGEVISMRVSAGKDLRTWRVEDYKKSYSSKEEFGGGAILDLIHEINYPAWLLDEEINFKNGISRKQSNLEIDCEDIAEGLFETTNGKIISIHVDYLQVPGRRYCEILGDKGTIIWEKLLIRGTEDNILTIYTTNETKIEHIKAGGNDMYREELKFFMEKIEKGERYSNLKQSIKDLENAFDLRKNGY